MRSAIALLPFALFSFGAAQAQEDGERVVERSVAERGDAMEVARHLFSPERMAETASAEIRPAMFLRPGFRLTVISNASSPTPALCERQFAYYDLDRPNPYPDTERDLLIAANEEIRPVIAIAPDGECPSRYGFVSDHEGLKGEALEEQLLFLSTLVSNARAGDDLSVEIRCRSDDPGRCDDHRAALASLPLHALRTFSVAGPTRIETSSSDRETRYATPVVDVGTVNVRASFNYDGATPSAWQVNWIVRNGKVEAVHLWRARVTYH